MTSPLDRKRTRVFTVLAAVGALLTSVIPASTVMAAADLNVSPLTAGGYVAASTTDADVDSYGAQKAIDGDLSTKWSSGGMGAASLTRDFEKLYLVKSVSFQTNNLASTPADNTVSYSIRYKDQNGGWQTQFTQTPFTHHPTDGPLIVTDTLSTPVWTSAIQINLDVQPNDWTEINELTIHADGTAPSRPAGTRNLLRTADQCTVETGTTGMETYTDVGAVTSDRDTSERWQGGSGLKSTYWAAGTGPNLFSVFSGGTKVAVAPGQTYAFSVYVKGSVPGETVSPAIWWADDVGSWRRSMWGEPQTITGGWQRIDMIGTAPLQGTYAHGEVYLNSVQGSTLWWDGAQFEAGNEVTPWRSCALRTPSIFGFAADNVIFDRDNIVRATLSEPSAWTITVFDENAVAVQSFAGQGNVVNQPWSAVQLPAGAYKAELKAVNSVGGTATATIPVTKVSNQTFLGIGAKPANFITTTSIKGKFARKSQWVLNAFDQNGQVVFSKQGTTPSTSASAIVDGSKWANGNYTYSFTVTDPLTGVSETSKPFPLVKDGPALAISDLQLEKGSFTDRAHVRATFNKVAHYSLSFYKQGSQDPVENYAGTAAAIDMVWPPDTDGAYSASLILFDDGGRSVKKVLTKLQRDTAITTGSVTADRTVVSPSRTRMNLSLNTGEKVQYQLDIRDSNDSVVRTMRGTSSTTLKIAVDGKDTDGKNLPNGPYSYTLTVTDLAGNSMNRSGTFDVDANVPLLTVNSVPIVTSEDHLDLSFTLQDDHPGTLEVTDGPAKKIPLSWTDSSATIPLSDGLHTVTVTAIDGAGNKTAKSTKVNRISGSSPRVFMGSTLLSVYPEMTDGTLAGSVTAFVGKIGVQSTANAATGQVTLSKGGHSLRMTVGNTGALFDGVAVTLPIAPYKSGAKIMVPVAFVATTFGYTVDDMRANLALVIR